MYDVVSGGAGFATCAASYIDELLLAVIGDLNCSSKCEDACSTCLLDSNTRHDANHLNRLVAIDWLGDAFGNFVSLPSNLCFLECSEYCHESIKEAISHQINKGAYSVKIWLSKDLNEWDLNSRHVHMFVYQMCQINNVELSFVLPNIALSEIEHRVLRRYQELGVTLLNTTKLLSSGTMVSLIESEREVISIASQSMNILSPNSTWLESNIDDMLVKSSAPQGFDFTEVDTSGWTNSENEDGKRVEVSSELNGEIKTFGDRFWTLIGDTFPSLKKDFEGSLLSEIKYTDRYLQSPWYIILFGELIRALPRSVDTSFELQTLFSIKLANGKLINHDWSDSNNSRQNLNLSV